ncbi:hypothetical protein I4U23_027711 [Adineta vaga]|nr:hypothetical protein I4U23_027711 [Adineta vaga]
MPNETVESVLNSHISWKDVGEENEVEHTYKSSSISTLEEYVKKIISFIGMQPCEQSDKVAENKTSHTLYLAGIYRGGHDVLVRLRMVLEGTSEDCSSTTTTIQSSIRSTDKSAVQVIASAIAYFNKQ